MNIHICLNKITFKQKNIKFSTRVKSTLLALWAFKIRMKFLYMCVCVCVCVCVWERERERERERESPLIPLMNGQRLALGCPLSYFFNFLIYSLSLNLEFAVLPPWLHWLLSDLPKINLLLPLITGITEALCCAWPFHRHWGYKFTCSYLNSKPMLTKPPLKHMITPFKAFGIDWTIRIWKINYCITYCY